MGLTRPSCQGRVRNEAAFGEGGTAGQLLLHQAADYLKSASDECS